MLAAKRERKMGDYKVVPVEPTAEMLEAYESASIAPVGPISKNGYKAMLAAAPAVQGEPVAFRYRTSESAMWNYVDWRDPDEVEKDNFEIQYLSAAPQSAEQHPAPHPDDAAVDRFAVAMKDKLAASREKGRHGWQNMTAPHLSALLYDHLYKADPLDVGNLAMMLHQNGQAIELPHEVRKTDTQPAPQPAPSAPTFQLGDHVRKTKGTQWEGRVVGTYSTTLTPEGYAVESDTEKGSVQIYPVGALELVGEDAESDVAGLVEALESSTHRLHEQADGEDDCRCGQCRFVLLRDAALAAHRKQGGEA